MSEQIPAEFAWIKPGVKVYHEKSKLTLCVETFPYFKDKEWVFNAEYKSKQLSDCLIVPCVDVHIVANSLKTKKITLPLTREQAEALRLLLSKQDGITRGFPEDERYYREIEKQIEEKLSK